MADGRTPMHTASVDMTTTSCPACHGERTTPFHSIAATPVTCTSIFDSVAEARAVPMGRVELAVCESCGFVFNRSFDAARAELGARYESSQAASAHFGQFARGLAAQWIERHRLQGKSVLEIGCGHGDFLHLMLGQGVAQVIGVDPLATEAPGQADPRLHIHAAAFDDDLLDLRADALVCRHTLEHIGPVHGFLGRVGQWAARDPQRVVLFELPDAHRVLAEGAFWDVYYEHCSYFTTDTLRSAFERAGLEVLRQELAYGGQYLLIEARAARAAPVDAAAQSAPRVRGLVELCHRFGGEVQRAVSCCDESLVRMAAMGRPIAVWQGAAKTVGFLAALKQADLVHCAVDLSEQRHGRFLPGTGLAVHAPEQLKAIRPGHVILMNPVYVDEVRARLVDMGVDTELCTIADLCG
ncbi:class I SAM-dependent methyltransferase [Variovorax sp. YR752]|uniref:class I SAM-dependent methyltransferase n=1 Tax=Variovorax sp. YR752 TaxID=1884383 RepID=UPI003138158B